MLYIGKREGINSISNSSYMTKAWESISNSHGLSEMVEAINNKKSIRAQDSYGSITIATNNLLESQKRESQFVQATSTKELAAAPPINSVGRSGKNHLHATS
jgi:hypothetical protein